MRSRKSKERRVSEGGMIVALLGAFLLAPGGSAVGAGLDPVEREWEHWNAGERERFRGLALPVLGEGEIGWEIELEIQDPTVVDLDMVVLPASSEDPPELKSAAEARKLLGGRLAICTSRGSDRFERCSFEVFDGPDWRRTWVWVLGFGGGATGYRMKVQALRGPKIAFTELYASHVKETRRLETQVAFEGRFGESAEERWPTIRLYEVELDEKVREKEIFVGLQPGRRDAPLRLRVYDERGGLEAESETSFGEHSLIVQPAFGVPSKRLFLEVSLGDRNELPRRHQFNLVVKSTSAFDPEIAATRARPVPLGEWGGQFRDRITASETTILVSLRSGEMALVTLERSEGFEMKIYSGRNFTQAVSVFKTPVSTMFAALGSPYGGFDYVYSHLPFSATFLIYIRKSAKPWEFAEAELSLREGRDLVRPFLVAFDPGKATEIEFGWRNRITTKASLGGDELSAFWLRSTKEARTVRARVSGSDPLPDLAICSVGGEVLGVGSGSTAADVEKVDPSEDKGVYIIVFGRSVGQFLLSVTGD